MTHKVIPTLRQFRTLLNFTLLPESWRKRLHFITTESFQPFFMVAFTVWLVGVVEVIQKSAGQRLDPRFWMLIALLITAYTGARIFRLSPLRSNLSARAKSAAADALAERMISNGLTVHHEENGSGRYVVVAPSGIYAMEVKARNVFGSGTVEISGDTDLVLGGRISDSQPLKQAKAAAQQLRHRLQDVLPSQPVIKPVVVFLNDWRITGGQSGQDVAVLNENDLQQYFDEQETVLDSSEIAKISACLT